MCTEQVVEVVVVYLLKRTWIFLTCRCLSWICFVAYHNWPSLSSLKVQSLFPNHCRRNLILSFPSWNIVSIFNSSFPYIIWCLDFICLDDLIWSQSIEYVLFWNSLFFFPLRSLIFHTDSQLWNVRFLDPLFPLCIVHDHVF